MSKVHVLEHPAVQHKLRYLRKPTTPHWEFERLIYEITLFLAVAATENLETETVEVETPLEKRAPGQRLKKHISLVAILRAGLAMVPALKTILPGAKVGVIGLARDEKTLNPSQYYENLPEKIEGDFVALLDPMLATGGSAVYAINLLKEQSARDLTLLSIIAAPEGIERMQKEHPDVTIYTAALDRELNRQGYILPGLGDAGDRIFGNFA